MKSRLVLMLCSILVAVNGWVGIIPSDPDTAHLGDCYTTSNNIGALKVGEVKRIEGQCAIATCGEDRDIGLTGCPSIAVMPPYKVMPGDLSKPFPECCHEIIGPNNNTENNLEPKLKANPSSAIIDVTLNPGSNLI